MSLQSMTGFARSQRSHGAWRLAWEIKSVNAKGLDLRLRTPPGFDVIEQEARNLIGRKLTRGACYATLTAQRENAVPEIRVNEAALASLVEAIGKLPASGAVGPASLDGLLAIKGVVDIIESTDPEEVMTQVHAAALAALDDAIEGIVAMRRSEGKALHDVLSQRLDTMAELAQAADECPGRKPDAVRARLEQSGRRAGAMSRGPRSRAAASGGDPHRRQGRHPRGARPAEGACRRGARTRRRGRARRPPARLSAQEFNREANTLCAKSNDPELTRHRHGAARRVEQFREQVQNIE